MDTKNDIIDVIAVEENDEPSTSTNEECKISTEVSDVVEMKKAGVFVRCVAIVIDMLLIQIFITTPFIALVLRSNSEFDTLNLVGAMVLSGGVIISKDLFRGASIGKRILGIVVLDSTSYEMVLSKKRLLIRNVLTVFWPVEFFAMLLRKDKKKIMDSYAHTDVFIDSSKKRSFTAAKVIACYVLLALMMFASTSMFVLKADETYSIATDLIKQDKVANDVTGGIMGFGTFPQGSINISNGTKTSELHIKVKGKKRDIVVYITMVKEPGKQWNIIEARYE